MKFPFRIPSSAFRVLLFFAVLGFFILTVPANHSEAEDAYEYARLTEQGQGIERFNSHHLLYLPLMQSIFRLLRLAEYDGRAFPVLVAFSMICGALTVSLFPSLLQRQRQAGPAGWIFALGLLFSCGFWRYSCTAEIYIPALLCAVAGLCLALNSESNLPRSIAAAALSAFGILIHLANAVPLAGGITFHYLLRRRFRAAAGHLLLVVLLTGTVYASIASTAGLSFTGETQPQEGGLNPAMIPKGLVAAGQALVSGNFLFAYPTVQHALRSLFPYRMLDEEIYMGRHIPPPVRLLAPLTLTALAVAGLLLLTLSIRRLRSSAVRHSFLSGWTADAWTALFWLAGTAALVLLTEPGNPELWVLALPPLWWLLAFCRPLFDRRLAAGWGALVLLLALHNTAGGMIPLRSARGDYNRQKADWFFSCTHPPGLIVTADTPVFRFYLRYHLTADVIALQEGPQAMDRVRHHPGPVYLCGDIFNPPAAFLRRFPASAAPAAQFAEQLRPHAVQLHDDEFGGVFRYDPAP